MRVLRSNFTTLVIVLGLLLTAAIAFHLTYRGLHQVPELPRQAMADANADRGREAMVRHGCGACHVVPGIRLATGRVGPKLEDIRNQTYIAGVLPNSSDNLALWIRAPRDNNPRTAMPNLDVSPQEARDMAVYLYSISDTGRPVRRIDDALP